MTLYESIIRPILFHLPPETAHDFSTKILKSALGNEITQSLVFRLSNFDFGEIKRFGLTFRNPLGVAAGFDKNGLLVNQLASLGFGFVEVGTVTFKPQSGNSRPRLFRLPQDEALINRLGFNNDGAEKIIARLEKIKKKCVVGVNIGRNKDVSNKDAVENYLSSLKLACKVADYITVNVSSPNTPELRKLQATENLRNLLSALQSAVLQEEKQNQKRIPLLVKIAPDLSDDEIESITGVCLELGIDGLIATNTTVRRSGLKTSEEELEKIGEGGLSGKPLAKISTEVIRKIYRYSAGKLPIIGVGGIFTAEDAFEKICAGASLLQVYTGFVYKGPSFAYQINSGLAKLLQKEGFSSIDEAIGSKA
ncbi:MAG: quinone-dependent dihydroorotate dehydrogenase [Acidobacteria bacterium]|jgi:dihydroorotate dehydrogenase|nr:MAG: quinone-dependent dihydroorotate dehydrogenase [Acidobacteriota bacterium]GIU83043.1 MAG: dihydroorotate dehydrogenase (quinone) [Pyrinomonadaceae bacterium]